MYDNSAIFTIFYDYIRKQRNFYDYIRLCTKTAQYLLFFTIIYENSAIFTIIYDYIRKQRKFYYFLRKQRLFTIIYENSAIFTIFIIINENSAYLLLLTKTAHIYKFYYH